LPGCSLISIKSPETPLTPREQESRLLTRDYAAHFAGTMTHLIDDAVHSDADPAILSQALRLKFGTVTGSTRAFTGLSPIGSLLDTWAFSVQLRDFLVAGAGATLLANAQPDVRLGATELADEADALARKVTGNDYPRYQTFVLRYARPCCRRGWSRKTTRRHFALSVPWHRRSAPFQIARASTVSRCRS
jgi:hypothetical protein